MSRSQMCLGLYQLLNIVGTPVYVCFEVKSSDWAYVLYGVWAHGLLSKNVCYSDNNSISCRLRIF